MLITRFYYVYFLTNISNSVLYIGVTNSLHTRIWKHKVKLYSDSFTSKYNCDKLVYFEEFESIQSAIAREKQLKNWKREWKNELVISKNPGWEDLAKDWFTEEELDIDKA